MTNVYCKMCPRHCYLGTLAIVEPPKDMLVPVPGTTPEGQETNDIRPYCKANFIPEPEN